MRTASKSCAHMHATQFCGPKVPPSPIPAMFYILYFIFFFLPLLPSILPSLTLRSTRRPDPWPSTEQLVLQQRTKNGCVLNILWDDQVCTAEQERTGICGIIRMKNLIPHRLNWGGATSRHHCENTGNNGHTFWWGPTTHSRTPPHQPKAFEGCLICC